jgi:hypothetical protein
MTKVEPRRLRNDAICSAYGYNGLLVFHGFGAWIGTDTSRGAAVNKRTLEIGAPGNSANLMAQAQYGYDGEGRLTDLYYPGALNPVASPNRPGQLLSVRPAQPADRSGQREQ